MDAKDKSAIQFGRIMVDAMDEERDVIVEWLRGVAANVVAQQAAALNMAADNIAAMAHWKALNAK